MEASKLRGFGCAHSIKNRTHGHEEKAFVDDVRKSMCTCTVDSELGPHPNAYAHPSQSDAEAAQWTEGVEMILGVRFSPSPLGLEWYDQEEGHRRDLNSEPGDELPVMTTFAGRKIHGFELIGYTRNGEAVNLVITEEDGVPIGLPLPP